MAKALFLGLPLHGHTNPTLALVRELVGRGEEIVYYSADAFAASIEEAGAQYRPYRSAFLADMQHLPDRMDQLPWLLLKTTAELLEHELDAFRAERPDYLITDSVAPWGQWVAEVLGVPVVTSVSSFAFNRRVLTSGLTRGARPKSMRLFLSKIRHITRAAMIGWRLRRRYGVRGTGIMGTMFGCSDLNIVYTSRYFQPFVDTFDDRFQFVGPSIAPRTEAARFPWEQAPHSVVVYVSLGTLFNTDATFYQRCFEAFQGEDFTVIMSVGTNVPVEALGPAPPNFIVKARVPQLEVLQRAAAFVTHGGMNSVSESLYYGVPVVVVPQMGEQRIIGRRVEELGAGLCFANEPTANELRDSVRRILAEDRFRQRAALMRESFQTAGGVARAADAIQVFTRRQRG